MHCDIISLDTGGKHTNLNLERELGALLASELYSRIRYSRIGGHVIPDSVYVYVRVRTCTYVYVYVSTATFLIWPAWEHHGK